jgi:hypothetical protein
MGQALQVGRLKELIQQLDDGNNVDAGIACKMSTSSYVCPI